MKSIWQSYFKTQLEKMSDSNFDNDDLRVARLETKVNYLLALVIIQTVILVFLFISSIIPSPATMIVMLIVTVAAVLLLNNYAPGWFGLVKRLFKATFRRDKKSATKMTNEPIGEDF